VAENHVESAKWYIKSAQQGYVKAQYNLGFYYENVKPRFFNSPVPWRAIEWYTRAAEQGEVEAQYKIGILCSSMNVDNKDLEKSKKWLTKAAEQGHANAQYYLKKLYGE
jgi:TPR repeat protein